MADDKKTPDEYEYPSEEYYKGGDYIPPQDPDEPLEGEEGLSRRPLLSKRLLSIIGILVAVVVVYLLLMYMNTRKRELAQATPAVDAGSASLPSAASAPENVAPQTPIATGPSPADQAALQRAAEQNQANQQTLDNLQNQIQQLQSQLTEVTNSVSTLTNQMQIIVNELRANSIDRSLRGRGMPLSVKGTPYTLKALVPGRAWLQAPDGHTTTVTIGDRLPGYGIIHMINTDQGIVTTSSGAIIQYGPRDN